MFDSGSSSFEKLKIWSSKKLRNSLDWYLSVSTNKMPAKYLIASKVEIETEDIDQLSYNELWGLHEKATRTFLSYWKKAKSDPFFIIDLPFPKYSLLSLNSVIVNKGLTSCDFCEWHCGVDRTDPNGKKGTCKLGTVSRVASYFPHHGEELVFRGTKGSGTIFFSSCNMRCVFCQNGDISKDKDNGIPITPLRLSLIMFELRALGVHNINLVGGDPTPHLHTIINAIQRLPQIHRYNINEKEEHIRWLGKLKQNKNNYLFKNWFNVPILWNSNFYISKEAMKILRTVIDVWLPDFKFGNNKCAHRLSRTPKYFETITRNLKLIHSWGENYVIRHLVMPNHVDCCSIPVLKWIKDNIPDAPVNIMGQYHPDSFTDPLSPLYSDRYSDISRRVSKTEVAEVWEYAEELGLNFENVTFY